jgi:type I restriction enzyme M protein
MSQLQGELRELLQQEEESKQQLKELFDKLGYTI